MSSIEIPIPIKMVIASIITLKCDNKAYITTMYGMVDKIKYS